MISEAFIGFGLTRNTFKSRKIIPFSFSYFFLIKRKASVHSISGTRRLSFTMVRTTGIEPAGEFPRRPKNINQFLLCIWR